MMPGHSALLDITHRLERQPVAHALMEHILINPAPKTTARTYKEGTERMLTVLPLARLPVEWATTLPEILPPALPALLEITATPRPQRHPLSVYQDVMLLRLVMAKIAPCVLREHSTTFMEPPLAVTAALDGITTKRLRHIASIVPDKAHGCRVPHRALRQEISVLSHALIIRQRVIKIEMVVHVPPQLTLLLLQMYRGVLQGRLPDVRIRQRFAALSLKTELWSVRGTTLVV